MTRRATNALMCLSLSCGLLAAGCNKEDQKGPTSSSPAAGAPSSSAAAPAAPTGAAVSATDLAAEFAKDDAAANGKYDGKTLTVSGNVTDTHTKPNEQGFVYLSVTLAGPAQGEGGGYTVKCNLPSSLKDTVEALKNGDAVKISGNYSHFSKSDKQVDLNMCSFAQ